MKPEDFSQFDDPRVREVMAAAMNLEMTFAILAAGMACEMHTKHPLSLMKEDMLALKAALFAAQRGDKTIDEQFEELHANPFYFRALKAEGESEQKDALIVQMQRGLLVAEHRIYKYDAWLQKMVFSCMTCAGIGDHVKCPLDEALIASGLPDQASRDAKRNEFGL